MAEFPALPLFTDAYLADAGHLTDAEHGRYLLMLMAMWRAPGCRLPNDDEWLARKFRRTPDEVKSLLRPIIAEFMQTDGNWITQKRLLREKEFVTKYSKSQSERAKRRWNKENSTSRGNAPTGNALTPTPTPIKDVGAKAPTPRKQKSGFPSNWNLTADAVAMAFAIGHGMGRDRALSEFERFHDHAMAHDRRQKDWPAAWRMWVTSPFQQSSSPRKEQKAEEWDHVRAKLRASIERDELLQAGGGEAVRLLPPNGGKRS